MTESILCIQRSLLPGHWVGEKSVVALSLDQFVETCTRAGFDFIDRSAAETDPSYKQIIPYILLQTRDRSQMAVYCRQGSEKRLHDLWSIGIGGHINPVDVKGQPDAFREILMQGMTRELSEELIMRPGKDTPEFLGIISEEETDVGSVHLGAVFRCLTDTPEAYLPGEELYDFSWKRFEALETLNMELWSRLALSLLEKRRT